MMRFSTTAIGGKKTRLEFWKIDVLPAEQPRINGPGARSDHSQRCAEKCQHHGNPGIAGMREPSHQSDPHVHGGYQHSRNRAPQPEKKKYSRANSDDFQDDCCQRRSFTQVGAPKMDERNTRKKPQEQKAYAWPTVSERRE